MSKCNDHWCEHYGKGSNNCVQCVKKESENNKSNIRAILKRRQVEQMDIGISVKKDNSQKR